jgi:hypothetical protein
MTAMRPGPGLQHKPLRRGRPPPLGPRSADSDMRAPAIDTFRTSIQAFVGDAEAHLGSEYPMSHLLARFGFQKRRFYDVVCVLSAIGCCEKRSIDAVFWFGQSRIPTALHKLQMDAGAHLAASTLDSIIGSSDTVSISPLTNQLMLCFLVLQMATLDIRHISRYLSRHTRRYKSTLCKLYQITHILEAAGIIDRSEIPGQLTMTPRYFVPIDVESGRGAPIGSCAYSIDALLNHSHSMIRDAIQARRGDFFAESTREDDESDSL